MNSAGVFAVGCRLPAVVAAKGGAGRARRSAAAVGASADSAALLRLPARGETRSEPASGRCAQTVAASQWGMRALPGARPEALRCSPPQMRATPGPHRPLQQRSWCSPHVGQRVGCYVFEHRHGCQQGRGREPGTAHMWRRAAQVRGRRAQRASTSDSRRLSERSARKRARSEFRRAPPNRAAQGSRRAAPTAASAPCRACARDLARSNVGTRRHDQHTQSGMFPCFRHGFSSFLSRSITSERQMRLRVSCGWITSSM
jgi:hypothetical protein